MQANTSLRSWALTGALLAASCGAHADIVNGGFELGTASGSAAGWTDTDSSFGYSRCSVAACATGGGTANAASGDYWIWFGGIQVAQSALLSQTTTIESGATALLFDFWAGLSDASAQLTLTIDGNIVWNLDNALAANYATGYSTVSIALDGTLADGGLHTITWNYGDSDGAQTNWNLDNVRLQQAAGTVPEPGSLALVGLAGLALLTAGRRRQA